MSNIFYQCKERFDSIDIYNDSDFNINIYIAVGVPDSNVYPDTLLPIEKPYYNYNIGPKELHSDTSQVEWERIIRKLPKDTLSIFISSYD